MTQFKHPIVIYHDKCPDGFCSAYIARMALPHAEFFAANYGEEPPDIAGKDVIILDFSYPRQVLLKMKEQASTIMVLDHHKSAAEDLAGLKFCIFDMERSGAALARDFFFPADMTIDSRKRHWIVDYVEDRDLWKWQLPNTYEINAAIESYPKDFEAWDKLWDKTPSDLVAEGAAIRRYQRQVALQVIEGAQEVLFQGHRVLIANNNVALHSEIANVLAEGRAFGIVWWQQSDGRYKYSLRSKPEGADVSQIAKLYGGGGHKHAAGFVSNTILHVSPLKL